MSSDKLGLSPASLSDDSDAAPVEAAPAAPTDAAAPAKRARRTLTRKPKAAPAEQLPLAVDMAPEPEAPAIIAGARSEPLAAPVETAIPPEPQPAPTAADTPALQAGHEAPSPAADADQPACLVAAAQPAVPAIPLTAPPLEMIAHRVYPVALGRKRDALQELLKGIESPTLVFTRTKHGADKIARFLERCGFKAAAIHGDKSHGARQRAISGFRSGEVRVLVITDIAARLLDVVGLPLVLSYDLPHVPEDYVQRVLRCGSADTAGLSLVLITQEEAPQFRSVRDSLTQPLELVELPAFAAPEAFDPQRDPPVRADGESASEGEAAAPDGGVAAASPAPSGPASGEQRPGRSRRERRRNRQERQRVAGEPQTGSEDSTVLDEEGRPAGNVAPVETRPARVDRPPRKEKERREKPEIGNRLPPHMRNPAPIPDDDDDGPQPGNTLDAPPPSHWADGNQGRRRGRRDPFAPIVIDAERASIWDERQPDDYRDQWSVLGPEGGRPSWTYAADGNVSEDAPRRAFGGPPQPRRGDRPRGPQGGGPRGGQQRGPRHNRPRRAEGR